MSDSILDEKLEHETFDETMRNLGVDVIRPGQKTLEEVKFYRPHTGIEAATKTCTISKTTIYFTSDFKAAVGDAKKLLVGVGTYGGKKVLVLKPGDEGCIINLNKRYGGIRVGTKNTIAWLAAQGVGQGRYEIVRVKGGFMGMPVEGAR